ncbi:MAG: hypothetical protein LBT23_08585 [Synergistaceae bacterium]|jgi:tetratricopeptide (TPR) repeat protein|nr:hypothetical protein [Synergistaceae bacterium]
MDEKTYERINALIKEIMEAGDDERRLSLAEEILELDPGSAIAKYFKWQSDDDDESSRDLTLLREAIRDLRPTIENLDENNDDDVMTYSLYVSMLSDLASFLYVAGEHEKAFDAAKEFMELDREGYITGRLVYYAVLIERGDFKTVLEAVEADLCETPAGEFCRGVASLELEGPGDAAAGYLLDAFSMDPDLPYYIMGLWTIDDEDLEYEDDEDGYIEETLMTVAVLSDMWSSSEERLAFLSILAFAFGYLTGRMAGADDMDMIEDSYRDAGCLEEMRESRDILHAMLASGKEQEEVDEEAISSIRKTNYFGLLG